MIETSINKLVAIGCSFTFGDELVDPSLNITQENYIDLNINYQHLHSFPGVIANHYNLQLENLSINGGSNDSISQTFMWYVNNHNTSNVFFIIGLTQLSRYSWSDNYKIIDEFTAEWDNFKHSTNLKYKDKSLFSSKPNTFNRWHDFYKLYNDLIASDDSAINNYMLNTMFIDGVAARNNIKVLQVNAIETPDINITLPTLYNKESMRSYIDNDEKNFCKHGHPSINGHQIIANKLIQYI